MTSPRVDPLNVIDEIDIRQNEVLDQLDALNARVEQLLESCSPPAALDSAESEN